MAKQVDLPIRLALRTEGDFWVAYLANATNMKNAKVIGSILIEAVKDRPERKQQFMQLMQDVMSEAIKNLTGYEPQWSEPHSAPESEKAGRA